MTSDPVRWEELFAAAWAEAPNPVSFEQKLAEIEALAGAQNNCAIRARVLLDRGRWAVRYRMEIAQAAGWCAAARALGCTLTERERAYETAARVECLVDETFAPDELAWAARVLRESGMPEESADLELSCGFMLLKGGQSEAAEVAYLRAAEDAGATGQILKVGLAHTRAAVCATKRDPATAIAHVEVALRALAPVLSSFARVREAEALEALGDALIAANRAAEGEAAYAQAIAKYTNGGFGQRGRRLAERIPKNG